MNYKITHICEPIYDLHWSSGRVAGIYNTCFNLLTDSGQLITIFKKSNRFSTRALLTDIDCPIPSLGLSEGEEAFREDESIRVGNLVFNLSGAEKILTLRSPITPSEKYESNFRLFAEVLEKNRKNSPIFEDGIIKEKASHGFKILKTDLLGGFEALIGLGIGLTPSCDDMLSGMSALFHLTNTGADFNTALASFLQSKGDLVTTTVSKNLLADCACGHINGVLYNVIHSILETGNDIEKHTLQLLEVGSSSGSETCAGILLGYNFLKDKEQIKWL